jgi:hypothetical protein
MSSLIYRRGNGEQYCEVGRIQKMRLKEGILEDLGRREGRKRLWADSYLDCLIKGGYVEEVGGRRRPSGEFIQMSPPWEE